MESSEMLVSQDIPTDILEGKMFDLFMAAVERHSSLRDYSELCSSMRASILDPCIRQHLGITPGEYRRVVDLVDEGTHLCN